MSYLLILSSLDFEKEYREKGLRIALDDSLLGEAYRGGRSPASLNMRIEDGVREREREYRVSSHVKLLPM